jgi:hypothetical protein
MNVIESRSGTRNVDGGQAGLAPVTDVQGVAVPLTEQILSRLPGRRRAWIIVWAVLPWLNLAVVAAAGALDQGPRMIALTEVLNRTAVTMAILVSLRGTARMVEQLRRLPPMLDHVVEQEEREVAALFRGIDSAGVPLVLTAVSMVILPIDEALSGQSVAALIQTLTWLIVGIPIWTSLWTYVAVQLGLDRIGRGHLTMRAYTGDRSLGLRPVGRLAFTGFWTLVGVAGPLILTSGYDIPGAVIATLALAVGVMLFFVSLRRLHKQMAAVKRREVERARSLYIEAYRDVRDRPTLEVLQRQSGLLEATEALEKRAERIQEWPFDERTFAQVVAIASSVAAGIIVRLILESVGL